MGISIRILKQIHKIQLYYLAAEESLTLNSSGIGSDLINTILPVSIALQKARPPQEGCSV